MSGKARRGNGEGSVYQDKNRVWHAKLTVGRYRNGKPRYKEFKGKRKADVIARRDAYQKEYGDLSLESGANIPFADYITRWIENVKRNEQKEATYIRTVSTANTYIIPMIGGYKVAELTSDIIQLHLINEMRDMTCERTGEELSWSSIQKAYIYTKACFCLYTKPLRSYPRALVEAAFINPLSNSRVYFTLQAVLLSFYGSVYLSNFEFRDFVPIIY